MKPTILKTQTTKRLVDLEMGESGTLHAGGLDVTVERWRHNGVFTVDGNSSAAEPFMKAKVTVTEERPMTVGDLRVGDCFRIEGQRDELAFMVWLGNHRAIKVWHDHPQTVQQVGEVAGLEVTLVTPTFEAKPVEEERAVPVGDLDEQSWFFFAGRKGKFSGLSCGWACVRWLGAVERTADLPPKTPVTVREQAAYDSWEDVSVGDVVIRGIIHKFPSIVCSVDSKGEIAETLTPPNEVLQNMHSIDCVSPARLTDVSFDRIPEVTR